MKDNKKILVVSHVETLRMLVSEILRTNPAYDIYTAEDGGKALEYANRNCLDIIIVDIMTPSIEEFQIAALARSGSQRFVPIIILSVNPCERGTSHTLTSSGVPLFSGAPFNPNALIERVEIVLQKHRMNQEFHYFLRLPGNLGIGRELAARTAQHGLFAVGYAEITDLKAFNQCYGSTHGDELIVRTVEIIRTAVKQYGGPEDIVKHISSNNFVFITAPEHVDAICEHIIRTFNRDISAICRQLTGHSMLSPLAEPPMKISIGVVTNRKRHFTDFAEIGEIAAELKQYLRTQPTSRYCIDRRVNRHTD